MLHRRVKEIAGGRSDTDCSRATPGRKWRRFRSLGLGKRGARNRQAGGCLADERQSQAGRGLISVDTHEAGDELELRGGKDTHRASRAETRNTKPREPRLWQGGRPFPSFCAKNECPCLNIGGLSFPVNRPPRRPFPPDETFLLRNSPVAPEPAWPSALGTWGTRWILPRRGTTAVASRPWFLWRTGGTPVD